MMHKDVKIYLESQEKWQTELSKLRKIVLECGLNEYFKWKHPSYSDNGKNIVLLYEFKDYCGILFYKGALLKDSHHILIQQTENIQSARQMRFTSIALIDEFESIIKMYIQEAIEIEKSGQKVEKKALSEYIKPIELEKVFQENPDFEQAFTNLTEGRQKAYLLYFSEPIQSKTKLTRIEKNKKRIFDGYGLNDCTCGLSKRKPSCDGSHKMLKINE